MIMGITGTFGSGKTTVAGMFKKLSGAKAIVLDADQLARRLMARHTPVYRRIVADFGRGIIGRGGAIDRRKLAEAVFGDRRLLQRLSDAVHPQVLRLLDKKIAAAGEKAVILDVPLLFEAKAAHLADRIVVVKINRRNQLKRLMRKRGFRKEDILRRINSQMPQAKKIRMADFVIDNNGDMKETMTQAAKIWRFLWKS